MKIKLFSVLMMLCAFVMYSNAQIMFRNNATSLPNNNKDIVASMTTDASGNTYVLQNLFYNIPGTTTSNSLSGVTGGTIATNGYSVMVIDIHNQVTGVVSNFATIRIAGSAFQSNIHGAAISIGTNGQVYVTGDFYGQISVPSTWFGGTTLPISSNSGSSDVFTFRFSNTGLVDAFNVQGGNGQEYGTAIAHSGTNVYVAGYYNAIDPTTESTTFTAGSSTTASSVNNNAFILTFDANLNLGNAYGWLPTLPANGSITPKGIIAQTTYLWITGGFTGTLTLGSTSISNTSITDLPRLFSSRIVAASGAYNWTATDGANVPGTGPHPTNIGSIGNCIYTEGGAIMVGGCSYNAAGGVYNGAADAVLIRYQNATSATPSVAWEAVIGSSWDDEVTAITNDGGGYIITGYCSENGGGLYYYKNASGTVAQTRNYVAGQKQVFIARYTTTGNLSWLRTGMGVGAKNTALSCNQRCYVSVGGNFNAQTIWDDGTVIGAASPVNDRLYAVTMPTREFIVTPSGALTYTKPASIPFTVSSGATTYLWGTIPSPITGVSFSAPTSTSTNLNATVSAPSGTFTVYVDANYTVNGMECVNRITRKVTLTGGGVDTKTDGTEIATSIEDVDQPILTFNTFPNPTTNKLTISYSLIENAPATLQAIDVLGRVVFERQVSAQYADETIDTDMWGNGAYIISLQQNGKVIASKNVLKQ